MFARALFHAHVHFARRALAVQGIEFFWFQASWKAARCTQFHLPKQLVLFQDLSPNVPLIHVRSWPVAKHKIARHTTEM
jgi:hypothetical protein